jgi:hypothetical protein
MNLRGGIKGGRGTAVCKIRSFIILSLHETLLERLVKKHEMGGACSTYWTDEQFWSENQKGRDHLWDTGIMEMKIINIDFKEIWCEDPNWIYLARGSVKWRPLVNTVINLLIPWKTRKLLISWATLKLSGMTLLRVVSFLSKFSLRKKRELKNNNNNNNNDNNNIKVRVS